MKVVLFGYHDVGCACLRALIDAGAEVALVVTHEDDPGENVWFGSVAEIARSRGIPLVAPDDVNAPELVARIRRLAPDVLLSAYFRQILGPELLGIAPLGAFNMHGSLLPRFRGRAPVNWVLVMGEKETGVTLHYMDAKPDRGDIVGQKRIPIEEDDTAYTLHRKGAEAAGALLRELWPQIAVGTAPRIQQDPALASYYGRRRPEDGRIDWSRAARDCRNLVRAVTHPYPGAFAEAGGTKIFVWKASVRAGSSALPPGTIESVVPGVGFVVTAGKDSLVVERGQVEGQGEMAGDELVRRGAVRVGQRFD